MLCLSDRTSIHSVTTKPSKKQNYASDKGAGYCHEGHALTLGCFRSSTRSFNQAPARARKCPALLECIMGGDRATGAAFKADCRRAIIGVIQGIRGRHRQV